MECFMLKVKSSWHTKLKREPNMAVRNYCDFALPCLPFENLKCNLLASPAFHRPLLSTSTSISKSKTVQNQGFRRNGHQIRILLVEIYRWANFEPKRTQPAQFFKQCSIFSVSVSFHCFRYYPEIRRKSRIQKKWTPYSNSPRRDIQVGKF